MELHPQSPLQQLAEFPPHRVLQAVLGLLFHSAQNSCSALRGIELCTFLFRLEPAGRQDKRRYGIYLGRQKLFFQRKMESDGLGIAFDSWH